MIALASAFIERHAEAVAYFAIYVAIGCAVILALRPDGDGEDK